MRCPSHNYEYQFLGRCPHCEAQERADRDARQREEQLAFDRQTLERTERQHEESLAKLEGLEEQKRRDLLDLEEERRLRSGELEEQRRRDLLDLEEERRLHSEELAEAAAQRHRDALEEDRRARVEHFIDTQCNAARRKLDAGRPAEALEDAQRALDRAQNNLRALKL
jgi:hypothetical protein